MSLAGKDMLPRVKELGQIVGDRLTNWCIAPCPHPEWAKLVYPGLPEDEAYEKLWQELEHVLRLDEPDAVKAWDERMAALNDSAARLAGRHFDAIELRGPGTELTVGMLPTHTWWAADFSTGEGIAPPAEPADGGGLHDARSAAHRGACRLDEAARPSRRDDHPRPARALRGRHRRRDRRGRERRGAPLPARDRRGSDAARRARAGRSPGPHRAARDGVLQHPPRRERVEPHRVRHGLPVPRRRRRRRAA